MSTESLPRLVPGFLDAPGEPADCERSRYVILPLPYDATCSYGVGARFGPARVIEASFQVEWEDEETGEEPWRDGICTLRPLEPDYSSPDAYHERVLALARRLVAGGRFVVGLGGEHGVSWGLFRAQQEAHPGLAVLQVDAHLDLRPSYQGTPASHACIARRVTEAGAPLVQVGVRNGSAEEWAWAREHGVAQFPAWRLAGRSPRDWVPGVLAALPAGAPVYLTVDVDGFDPSVFPGTGTPDPGGLGWWEGLALFRALFARFRVVGFDVVEVAPIPGSLVTEYAAARLVHRLLAYERAARLGRLGERL